MFETPGDKLYREIDVEAMYRIIEPMEEELDSRFRSQKGNQSGNDTADGLLTDIMASLIFETLDEFPVFSELVDRLQTRLGECGVSMVEQ